MVGNNDEERGNYGRIQDEHPDDPISELLQTNLLTMNDFSEDSSPPTPRFIQDEGSYKYLKWAPVPLRRVSKAAARWANGPNPPHIHTIRPLFPFIQEAPIRLLDKYIPKKRHRILILVAYYFLWILTFAVVMERSSIATEIEGWGAPGSIGCGNTYWVPGNRCGLNGNECRPFNGSGFAFRCPANCANHIIANPRAVGAQEVNYRPFVIGGPSVGSKMPI